MDTQVKKVAELARLHLSEQELRKMEKDIQDILNCFRILSEPKTEGVKPSFQPVELKNVTRKDEVEPSLPREKALQNTKNKREGYFLGPASG